LLIVAWIIRRDRSGLFFQPAQHLVELIEIAVTNAENTAALAIVGMCLWTAWWVEQSPLEQLTAQIADQAVSGVLAVDGDLELEEPAALLRAARANLDRLQATLDA